MPTRVERIADSALDHLAKSRRLTNDAIKEAEAAGRLLFSNTLFYGHVNAQEEAIRGIQRLLQVQRDAASWALATFNSAMKLRRRLP